MVKKDLYILGAGGFAKEVYFLAKAVGVYNVKAFVDVHPGGSIRFAEGEIPVIGDVAMERAELTNCCLAIGVGEPTIIERLMLKYQDRFEFPNLVHPSVIGDFENIDLGRGNIVTANVVFTTHIRVGNFNVFNLGTTVGHDVVIGDGNVINPCVNISGGVSLGSYNLIGVGAIILQYKTIGSYSTVGAAAMVNADVESKTIVVGIPAKKMTRP